MPDQLEMLSRFVDDELSEDEASEVERLLASSAGARETLDHFLLLRRELREDEAGPDVTSSVLATIRDAEERKPRLALRVAAAFLAGIIGGIAFIGLTPSPPSPMAAADVPAEVIAAQSLVTSLHAELSVIERGWNPEVTERRYTGSILFSSPESLRIEFEDETVYPSADWVPNHTTHVIDEDVEWSRAVARCPREALPSCTPAEPRLEATRNREPFPVVSTSALDVVVPVGGFVRAAEPTLLGHERRDGRVAIGIRVTAAQLDGLIDGLVGQGNWREFHPTDPVELWLDVETLVPLALSVYPADTADRELWAIRHGYTDETGEAVLEAEWRNVIVNDGDEIAYPPPPAGAATIDFGFVDEPPSAPDTLAPSELPEGMTLHRTGTIQVGSAPRVSTTTWTDGRAWLKLEWTRDWSGDRLFGDIGLPARQVAAGSGVGYLNERGDRIGLHGSVTDAVLTGSLPTSELVAVAGSIGMAGQPVPPTWAEAATATLDEAREAIDPVLAPSALEGFAAPAIRVESGSVSMSYAGAGNRGFVVTQTVGQALSPPLEAKMRGVTVRETEGRYNPELGVLEWMEGDLAVSLRSTSLSLAELLAIAESLEPA